MGSASKTTRKKTFFHFLNAHVRLPQQKVAVQYNHQRSDENEEKEWPFLLGLVAVRACKGRKPRAQTDTVGKKVEDDTVTVETLLANSNRHSPGASAGRNKDSLKRHTNI